MIRPSTTSRRGAVLIMVLVCLGIATTLILGIVQSSLHQRRHLRQELQLEQTRWLLDAGISRAVSRVQSQPAYEGELLTDISAFENYPYTELQITIVNRDPNDRLQLRVTARLGSSVEQASTMQRSKEIIVRRPEE